MPCDITIHGEIDYHNAEADIGMFGRTGAPDIKGATTWHMHNLLQYSEKKVKYSIGPTPQNST